MARLTYLTGEGGQLTPARDDVTGVASEAGADAFEAGVSRAASFGDIMRLIIYNKL